jgi:outer membrane cobalamin receptor
MQKFFLLFLALPLIAFAEKYESTIAAKKIKKSTQFELNSDEISKNSSLNFAEFLNFNSAMQISPTLMAPTQWSLRGANASHTLLLVDEKPIFDPSTIQGTWNLTLWPNSWIKDAILDFTPLNTVLKWGGQASGGVVAIETSDQDRVGLFAQASKSAGVNLSKNFHRSHFFYYGHKKNTPSPFENSRELYPNDSNQAMFKIQVPISENSLLDFSLLKGTAQQWLPEWANDSKYFKSSENHQITSANWRTKSDFFVVKFSIQYSDFHRNYLNTSANNLFDENYLGSGLYFGNEWSFNLDNEVNIDFGFVTNQEHIKLQGASQTDLNQIRNLNSSYFNFENKLFETTKVSLGGRFEQILKSKTYVLNPAFGVHSETWSIGWSKSLHSPSLFQSFDPISGNRNLQAENIINSTIEFHDQLYSNHYQLVVFDRKTKNAIDYDLASFKYENMVSTQTKGLELHWKMPFDFWHWQAIGTLQDSKNHLHQKTLSDQIFKSTWAFDFSEDNQWQLALNWNSEILSQELPEYSLWNLAWQVRKHYQFSIHNLTQTKVVRNKQYLISEQTFNLAFNTDF